jgi:hypothetical protein
LPLNSPPDDRPYGLNPDEDEELPEKPSKDGEDQQKSGDDGSTLFLLPFTLFCAMILRPLLLRTYHTQ